MFARIMTGLLILGLPALALADPRPVSQSYQMRHSTHSYHGYHDRHASSWAYRQGYRDGLRDQRYRSNYHRDYRHRLQAGTRYHQHGPRCGHRPSLNTRVNVYWLR